MPTLTCFQHIDCEGPGTLEAALEPLGLQLKILKPFQGDAIPVDLGAGLVVLGGPMGVYEQGQYPWMSGELAAIRKALDASLPILGVCLGSQMLAHAAGAQVFRGALPEVGWRDISLTAAGKKDPLLTGLGESFPVFHWHGDTFTLPKGAELLAGSDWFPHQIFRIGEKAYGFQCHLEVTEAMVESWAQLYAKELVPAGGPTPEARVLEDLKRHSAQLEALAAKVFTRFAKLI
ncbi:MAG TPA: gamma-glutamyl-gamma-aminobutyrate hydrolase family protein [bacterium]|nr:gamma-glutamyl-gamma-aminobutyrate hydrolase family protein [bacterium]